MAFEAPKNKQVDPAKKAAPAVTTKEQFHFPGSGEFVPMTIEAGSFEEALAQYEATRKPVTAPVGISTPPAADENEL